MWRKFFEYLGSPAVIAELRDQNSQLKLQLATMEERLKKFEDVALQARGNLPIWQEPPVMEPRENPLPYEQWVAEDRAREIRDLELAAQVDPETYLPLLADARRQYNLPETEEVN